MRTAEQNIKAEVALFWLDFKVRAHLAIFIEQQIKCELKEN